MLNEKAVLAACDAYHADLPTHDYPSKWAMEQAITAYLSAASPEAPEDVAGLVKRLNGATMRFDWGDLPDDAAIPAVPLIKEAAAVLTRIAAERDEARAAAEAATIAKAQLDTEATRLRGELARVEELEKALLAVVTATRTYLPPDGIEAKECLSLILAATDNPVINPIIAELESAHARP